MIDFKSSSKKDFLIHTGIIFCVILILFLGFFFVYLPINTYHGKSISVPKLEGKTIEEIKSEPDKNDLNYEINDSNYIEGKKPLTILSQYPLAGLSVKPGRIILLTVSSFYPPQVKMPKLVDLSLRSAEMQLQSLGLKTGKITYVPELSDAVLKQMRNNNPIDSGTVVFKGSAIDLIVGDGKRSVPFKIIDYVGKTKEEALFSLNAQGLKVNYHYSMQPDKKIGTVYKQIPMAGKELRAGESVDIYISGEKPQPKVEKKPVIDSIVQDSLK